MFIKHIDCDAYISNNEKDVKYLAFRIQKILLKHTSSQVKKLISETKNKIQKINFNPVDSSGQKREKIELFLKSFAGILIEEICYKILKAHNKSENVSIKLDSSNTSINQIDIKISKKWKDENNKWKSKNLTIEIRSSFPFKPIESIVCNDFDILGAYTNTTKIKECSKDFYLRFVFALEYNKENYSTYTFNNKTSKKINYNKTTINTLLNDYFDKDFNLKKDLIIYFVGGATKEMMNNESISYFGSMKSEVFNRDSEGTYRKLKIRNALDSVCILRQILGVISSENIIGK